VYSTFCTNANSLSHLYTHTMNKKELSFHVGECHALVCFLLLLFLFPLFLFSYYYSINQLIIHAISIVFHYITLRRWSRRATTVAAWFSWTTEDSVAYHRPVYCWCFSSTHGFLVFSLVNSSIIWVHIVNRFTGSLVLNQFWTGLNRIDINGSMNRTKP